MPEIVVLDTHIWVWWLNDKFNYLSAQQIDCIEQAERVAVSVISCFEVAQLVKRERLILPLPINEWVHEALTPAGVEALPLSPVIACLAVNLTDIHKDPFDRMIIATALHNQAKLMSVDGHFKNYPELHGHLIDT
ncbi:PilT protein domain protein [Crenothrix polyspora]|uniref:PilT protein domain protein n=1 Tax=Crenothrix polyspora TaxID=360316 RepID=A0A1R4GZD5_9GAMM|nr:type II toxin-antitoxin system VapC family toxin [Crenothrix polyspora]SJM89363.1 PilT protein domain protein [Crenothrix polyspora]